MIETALLPFQFPFMQNAFLIGILVAVPTALLSCFLVLKGWALMGDAVSHAVLPGIVLAWITGLPGPISWGCPSRWARFLQVAWRPARCWCCRIGRASRWMW